MFTINLGDLVQTEDNTFYVVESYTFIWLKTVEYTLSSHEKQFTATEKEILRNVKECRWKLFKEVKSYAIKHT